LLKRFPLLNQKGGITAAGLPRNFTVFRGTVNMFESNFEVLMPDRFGFV